jgi:hypothetical protein
LLPAFPARGGGEPCLASAALEPTEAFVGQQVLYRMEILRREDVRSVGWGRAPSFPSFRAEWLPGRSAESPILRGDLRYRGFEERRALFPVRSGELVIPSATLRCRVASPQGEEEFVVALPATRLVVRDLPEANRPEKFAGVVGRIRVHTRAEPRSLVLGGSTRISVVVEGESNVWRVPSPLDPAAHPLPHADLLPHPPELAKDAGQRLSLRRYFAYDLVPLRPGTLRLPDIEVPYFDPHAGRYAVATASPLTVEVLPATPDPGTASSLTPQVEPARSAPTPSPAMHLPLVLGAATALALAWAVHRRRRSRPSRVSEGGPPGSAALADADAARLGRLARALRLALDTHLPGARSRSAEELLEAAADDSDLRAGAELLIRLDRARFAREDVPAPTDESVDGVVERLRRR